VKRATYLNKAVSELSIQAQILAYIKLQAKPGVFAFAIPNAGKRGPRAQTQAKREGMMSGVSDLAILMPGGRVAWLEVKRAKGKQTPMQKVFSQLCYDINHLYGVAYSLDDAIVFLKHWDAIR
jgi:hypothetical protein